MLFTGIIIGVVIVFCGLWAAAVVYDRHEKKQKATEDQEKAIRDISRLDSSLEGMKHRLRAIEEYLNIEIVYGSEKVEARKKATPKKEK